MPDQPKHYAQPSRINRARHLREKAQTDGEFYVSFRTPEDAHILRQEAQDSFDEAERYMTELLDEFPKDADLHHEFALLLRTKAIHFLFDSNDEVEANYKRSLHHFRKAHLLKPWIPEYVNDYTNELAFKGNRDTALNAMLRYFRRRQTRDRRPMNATSKDISQLGRVFEQTGDIESAQACVFWVAQMQTGDYHSGVVEADYWGFEKGLSKPFHQSQCRPVIHQLVAARARLASGTPRPRA